VGAVAEHFPLARPIGLAKRPEPVAGIVDVVVGGEERRSSVALMVSPYLSSRLTLRGNFSISAWATHRRTTSAAMS
jgi:hypothetical protein